MTELLFDPNVVGAVAGAAITAAATLGVPYVARRQRSRAVEGNVTGTWEGHWEVLEPSERREVIGDTLELALMRDGRIQGSGASSYGQYLVEGFNNPFAMVLLWHSADASDHRAGVAFLAKEVTNRTLRGDWIQIGENNVVLRGTAKLNRR
jgi:hypothetical protein